MAKSCSLFLVILITNILRVATERTWHGFWSQKLTYLDDERQVHRLAQLMRGYFERTQNRFTQMLAVKTDLDKDHDKRRAFEKGYTMGEIVETYRKAVVFTQKQMIPKRYTESDRIRYMMYVQKAYIKVYHLTHMMHEIDPKFGTDNTGQISAGNMNNLYHEKTPTHYNTSGFYYAKELDDIRQARVQERKNKVKKEHDMRLFELAKHGTVKPGTIKTTTNWWPMAYGWDIDYYW